MFETRQPSSRTTVLSITVCDYIELKEQTICSLNDLHLKQFVAHLANVSYYLWKFVHCLENLHTVTSVSDVVIENVNWIVVSVVGMSGVEPGGSG